MIYPIVQGPIGCHFKGSNWLPPTGPTTLFALGWVLMGHTWCFSLLCHLCTHSTTLVEIHQNISSLLDTLKFATTVVLEVNFDLSNNSGCPIIQTNYVAHRRPNYWLVTVIRTGLKINYLNTTYCSDIILSNTGRRGRTKWLPLPPSCSNPLVLFDIAL